ncbi:OmpW/AlkL family protein [Stutzerimonas stutzeri]|uniref:OmpW/AlkL family protein n=1 Tax=Stutzerimonas stutzeri TaxID=316 RepID=UPI0002D5424F|nr:OmpW family outer membrane protein [Stutzerimonas stutzeri]
MRKTLFTASVLAVALASPFAQAHQAGDVILRAGAITVDPREDSGSVFTSVTGSIAGSKATLDSDTQLGLNFAYMVTDKVGIELLAATPFEHSVGLSGMPAGLDGDFADVKHLPPTLSLVYYPMDTRSVFQPYVGLGVNYTIFFDEELNSRRKGEQFSNLELDDSWGLAAQVGMDFMLTDQLMLNAQVRYIDIDTEATADSAFGKVKVDVDVDPMVYMVGLGYKF